MAEWTSDTTQTALEMVKVDLGIKNAIAYDSRLTQYIEASKSAIVREGATLSDEVEDVQLVAMYAGWLWRKRDTGEGMPRNLRWMLNNRIFSEKARS
jgi:hypothetical protein